MTDLKITDVKPFLSGVDYPASRSEIVRRASERGASDSIIDNLRRLPEHDYESHADIEDELARMR